MTLTNYVIITISSIITVTLETLSFGKLSKSKFDFNLRNVILLILSGVLVTFITYNINAFLRTFISFTLLCVLSLYTYRNSISETFLYSIICYIFVMLCEIIFSIIISNLNIININMLDNSILVKSIMSFITLGFAYSLCNNKYISKISQKIVNKINNLKYILIILVISLIFLIVIDYKFISSISKSIYFSNLLILICFIVITCIAINSYFKVKEEMEKEEALLNFMSKYEKIIEENRINKHEMLNNLLILKSIDDKNSDEFNETLNDLIDLYNNKSYKMKNIYKLPAGLKGVFYYKLSTLKENNFNININVSKQLSNLLKKLNHKEYVILCKIVGIILDNAIEASEESKEKMIGVDVYKEKDSIIIMIINSCKKKVNINKVSNINYSTKGKGRGLGLYIANNILKNSTNIKMEQSVNNNIFETKIIIN